MFIYLQIFNSIIRLFAYIMGKIQGLVGIYYQLQNNNIALLCRLFDKYVFWDLDLDKI